LILTLGRKSGRLLWTDRCPPRCPALIS
jgi:hypothetical protein